MRFLLLPVLLFSLHVAFAQHDHTSLDPDQREVWIKETVKELKANKASFSILKETPAEITDVPDYFSTDYRIMGNTLIRCLNGQWIYIRPHSSHENAAIGDISLAITSKGKLYIHEGHICGGIIGFKSNVAAIPKSPNDFFERFSDDIDHQYWRKIKN